MRIDPYRSLVFPNNLRTLRRAAGYETLMLLADDLLALPYIRLSKIERGEVFAKADELCTIATLLEISATDILIDIDDPAFDIADWVGCLGDWTLPDPEEDRLSVLLGAAVRHRRQNDPALTIAEMERRYGLAPVTLSRIEHGTRPLDKWNAVTTGALRSLFGVEDIDALRSFVLDLAASHQLDEIVEALAHPRIRVAKARGRIAELRRTLSGPPLVKARRLPVVRPGNRRPVRSSPPVLAGEWSVEPMTGVFPVIGTPLANGLISPTPTGTTVRLPPEMAKRAYAVRAARPTLGLGLPAGAILIVDPDRAVKPGGLAIVTEAEGLRVVSINLNQQGVTVGYSLVPPLELAIDDYDPGCIHAVIGAIF